MDFISFVSNHFAHAAPILFLGAVAIAIMLERFQVLFISSSMSNMDDFFKQISQLVMSSKLRDAVGLCNEHISKPVARITKAALDRAHLPEGLIQDGIQIALHKSTQNLTKRTNFLATIANVATLLGLFGTIAGLIQSFEAVGHADPQQKSALLSAGIATAMNATMLGLGVAIPCMLAFSFLMSKSNRLISDLEETSVHIYDILKQRFYASEFIENTIATEAKESK